MEMEMLTINKLSLSLTDNMSVTSPLVSFDLPSLIENMKHSITWSKGELNAMLLLNNGDTQVMLTALHEKTEISAFQASDSVTIHIIEGELIFHAVKKTLTIREGQCLTLHDKVKYSLKSIEETVFLLTISHEHNKNRKADN